MLAAPHNFEDEIIAEDLERRFASLLTESQKEVFYCVMLGGEKQSEYAKRKGVTDRAIRKTIEMIQKKAKIISSDCPVFAKKCP